VRALLLAIAERAIAGLGERVGSYTPATVIARIGFPVPNDRSAFHCGPCSVAYEALRLAKSVGRAPIGD